jgi:hypothetical protein
MRSCYENENIVYRNIVASVILKDLDGVCKVKTASYGQKHQGYGDFGPLIFEKYVKGYYDYTIPCDKVENPYSNVEN